MFHAAHLCRGVTTVVQSTQEQPTAEGLHPILKYLFQQIVLGSSEEGVSVPCAAAWVGQDLLHRFVPISFASTLNI